MAKKLSARLGTWVLLAVTVAACQAPLPTVSRGASSSSVTMMTGVRADMRQPGALKVSVRWPEKGRSIQELAYRTQAIELMVFQSDGQGGRVPARRLLTPELPPGFVATDSETVLNPSPTLPDPVNNGEASPSGSPTLEPGVGDVEPIIIQKQDSGYSRQEAEFVGLLAAENVIVSARALDGAGNPIGFAEVECDVIPGTSSYVALEMRPEQPPEIRAVGDWLEQPLGPGATVSVSALNLFLDRQYPIEAFLELERVQETGTGPNSPVAYPDPSWYPNPEWRPLELKVRPVGGDMLEIQLPESLGPTLFRDATQEPPVLGSPPQKPEFELGGLRYHAWLKIKVDGIGSNKLPLLLIPDFGRNPSPGPTVNPDPDPTINPDPSPSAGHDGSGIIDNLDSLPTEASVWDVGQLMCDATGSLMTPDSLLPWGIRWVESLANPSYGPPGQNTTEGQTPAFYGRDFGLCALGSSPFAGVVPAPETGHGAGHLGFELENPAAQFAIDFIGGPMRYSMFAEDSGGIGVASASIQIPVGDPAWTLRRLRVAAPPGRDIRRVMIGAEGPGGVLIRRLAYISLPPPPPQAR